MADHILGVDGPSVTIPTGVAASSGAQFGNATTDVVESSAWSPFFGGGDVGTFFLDAASYPSWLTGGSIQTPGLYALTMMVDVEFAGSSSDWTVRIESLFGNVQTQLFTPSIPSAPGVQMLQDVQAFQAADLTQDVGFKYWIPTIVTWGVAFRVRVARLGY